MGGAQEYCMHVRSILFVVSLGLDLRMDWLSSKDACASIAISVFMYLCMH